VWIIPSDAHLGSSLAHVRGCHRVAGGLRGSNGDSGRWEHDRIRLPWRRETAKSTHPMNQVRTLA